MFHVEHSDITSPLGIRQQKWRNAVEHAYLLIKMFHLEHSVKMLAFI